MWHIFCWFIFLLLWQCDLYSILWCNGSLTLMIYNNLRQWAFIIIIIWCKYPSTQNDPLHFSLFVGWNESIVISTFFACDGVWLDRVWGTYYTITQQIPQISQSIWCKLILSPAPHSAPSIKSLGNIHKITTKYLKYNISINLK